MHKCKPVCCGAWQLLAVVTLGEGRTLTKSPVVLSVEVQALPKSDAPSAVSGPEVAEEALLPEGTARRHNSDAIWAAPRATGRC